MKLSNLKISSHISRHRIGRLMCRWRDELDQPLIMQRLQQLSHALSSWWPIWTILYISRTTLTKSSIIWFNMMRGFCLHSLARFWPGWDMVRTPINGVNATRQSLHHRRHPASWVLHRSSHQFAVRPADWCWSSCLLLMLFHCWRTSVGHSIHHMLRFNRCELNK